MSSNANMYTVHKKKKKKKESNAFMKGEECVKEVILDTRVSNAGMKQRGRKRWMVCEALLLDRVLLSEPGTNQVRFNYSSLWLPHFTLSEPDST